ncbi:Endoplasmic oxidoreductin-2 [Platanthera guangdongensis]|uniref:Endoplasmic oxidoreductin-2 n=1 Tax=Platanthera guangdongensis TaxID=2320717 RepID=A0ABR2MAS8_9ASPA
MDTAESGRANGRERRWGWVTVALIAVFLATAVTSRRNFFFQNSKKACELAYSDKYTGIVEDCSCGFETVDSLNEELLHPILQELVTTPFFRYFKAKLWCDCPFWPDDGMCRLRDCSVCECPDNEFPELFKKPFAGLSTDDLICQEGKPEAVVDRTLDSKAFRWWVVIDNPWTNDDETDNDEMTYVNLQLNPERYTGYVGPSARRIWEAIYTENCPRYPSGELCPEKRVLYKLISGLHASISVHIASDFLLDEATNMWGQNLELLYDRVLRYPERVRNFCPRCRDPVKHDTGEDDSEGKIGLVGLYLTVESRSGLRDGRSATRVADPGCGRVDPVVLEAGRNWWWLDLGWNAQNLDITSIGRLFGADYLEQAEYSTGNPEDDLKTQSLVRQLVYNPKLQAACPVPFDEAKLWKGESGPELKQLIQKQFRNISALMDCVGCEKCRLWGKLQVLGLGTALQILFSVNGRDHVNQPARRRPGADLNPRQTTPVYSHSVRSNTCAVPSWRPELQLGVALCIQWKGLQTDPAFFGVYLLSRTGLLWGLEIRGVDKQREQEYGYHRSAVELRQCRDRGIVGNWSPPAPSAQCTVADLTLLSLMPVISFVKFPGGRAPTAPSSAYANITPLS